MLNFRGVPLSLSLRCVVCVENRRETHLPGMGPHIEHEGFHLAA